MSNEIDGEDLNPILDAIDAAEDIPDPLDGLVEKSAEDPGAAFTPEVLERQQGQAGRSVAPVGSRQA